MAFNCPDMLSEISCLHSTGRKRVLCKRQKGFCTASCLCPFSNQLEIMPYARLVLRYTSTIINLNLPAHQSRPHMPRKRSVSCDKGYRFGRVLKCFAHQARNNICLLIHINSIYPAHGCESITGNMPMRFSKPAPQIGLFCWAEHLHE